MSAMNKLFSGKNDSQPSQPTITAPAPKYDLADLFDELGRMRWHRNDASWNSAIADVRKEILSMVNANKKG